MSIPTTTASPWPCRAAYFSAAVFIGASGATNVLYGWSKGTDLPTSLVWAGVAGAVAVIFALAWPAVLKSLEAKRWSAAALSLFAVVLAGSYSVTAALGSAAGGRMDAAAQEKDTTGTRKRAQDAYDTAKAELATLKPTRTVGELTAMRDGWRRAYANQPWVLEPELARAKRRAELEAKMDGATKELKTTGPAKVANSDAKVLSRYMAAVGADITLERLTDLLVLLAVLMIEAGGGLSLAVGMALSSPAGAPTEAREAAASTPHWTTRNAPNGRAAQPSERRVADASGDCLASVRPSRVAPATRRPSRDIHGHSGLFVVQGSQRSPPAREHRQDHRGVHSAWDVAGVGSCRSTELNYRSTLRAVLLNNASEQYLLLAQAVSQLKLASQIP
jgi:hypothetical protein